jgi:hypothetical protein
LGPWGGVGAEGLDAVEEGLDGADDGGAFGLLLKVLEEGGEEGVLGVALDVAGEDGFGDGEPLVLKCVEVADEGALAVAGQERGLVGLADKMGDGALAAGGAQEQGPALFVLGVVVAVGEGAGGDLACAHVLEEARVFFEVLALLFVKHGLDDGVGGAAGWGGFGAHEVRSWGGESRGRMVGEQVTLRRDGGEGVLVVAHKNSACLEQMTHPLARPPTPHQTPLLRRATAGTASTLRAAAHEQEMTSMTSPRPTQIGDTQQAAADKWESVGLRPYDYAKLKIDSDRMSLEVIIRRLREGSIRLEADFQRTSVWTNAQMTRWIESILIRFLLPAFYFDGSIDIVKEQAAVRRGVEGVLRGSTRSDGALRFSCARISIHNLISLDYQKKINQCGCLFFKFLKHKAIKITGSNHERPNSRRI